MGSTVTENPRKRKLNEDGSLKDEPTEKDAPPSSSSHFEEILKHSVVNIFRAVKTAASFEKQKLGRRKQEARSKKDGDYLQRLEREETILKGFDLYQLAEYHLYKTLLRIKTIVSAPSFPSFVSEKVEASKKYQEPAYLNVSARLFKSSYVTESLNLVLCDLYEAVGAHERAKQLRRQAEVEKNPKLSTPKRETKITTPDAPHLHDRVRLGDIFEEFRWEPPFGQNRKREREGADSILPPNPQAKTVPKNSPSSEESSGSTDDDEEIPQKVSKTYLKESTLVAPKTTAFLPSLAAGYFSGSDTDGASIEDIEEEQPRKNRRGQRARQAIAELKFGAAANHIKKQRGHRDHGWDPKRGAQDGPKGSHKEKKVRSGKDQGAGRDKRDSRPDATSRESNPQKRATKPLPSNKPMHPSWEAAKKQKEQKISLSFQGKKITFD